MLRLRQDITLFPGGRKKAFTLSSDDGITQDIRLTELMRKYGIKGTFHLNSGLMGDRDWLIQPGIDVSHYKLVRQCFIFLFLTKIPEKYRRNSRGASSNSCDYLGICDWWRWS